MVDSLFTNSGIGSVDSNRIIYTPSNFARSALIHLQETGILQAIHPHKSERAGLNSCLFFTVLNGDGTLTYGGKQYELSSNDCVFIDCKKTYSHETGISLTVDDYCAKDLSTLKPSRVVETANKNQDKREEFISRSTSIQAKNKEGLWALQWCHFYGPNMNAIYQKYQERGGKPVFHPKRISDYRNILTELYQIAKSDDYVRDMRIHEKLSSLLILLMEDAWDADKRAETSSDTIDIQKVKEYLDANFKEKITLDGLASRFYISKYYLLELFKERYGVTVNAYLKQLRVTYIKKQLRFTDETVECIAEELHIEPTYLSRLFKKMEGTSPSKFRKTWRGSGTARHREDRNLETEEENQKKLHNI